MILWIFFTSLLMINTGCFYHYESAMAKNSTDLKDFATYRESVDSNTRQAKLYSKFNTVMIANVSLLRKKEIQQYRSLTKIPQLETEQSGEQSNRLSDQQVNQQTNQKVNQVEVDFRQEDFLEPFFNDKSLIFFLSIHVPPPTRYLADKFLQYWHVAFRRIATDHPQELSQAYSIKIHDIKDLDKEIAVKYFPYVNRWSSEYVITVKPNTNKDTENSLQLVLTSELGQVVFTW